MFHDFHGYERWPDGNSTDHSFPMLAKPPRIRRGASQHQRPYPGRGHHEADAQAWRASAGDGARFCVGDVDKEQQMESLTIAMENGPSIYREFPH